LPTPHRPGPGDVGASERHQTLEGFGASLAWHSTRSSATRRLESTTRSSPTRLDILRLRNRYQRSKREDGDLSQEVEILRRATEALGHPPKIMLSSWSPPPR